MLKRLFRVALFPVLFLSGAACAGTIEFQGHEYIDKRDLVSGYFYDTPVRVGETRTLRIYYDYCANFAKGPDLIRCGMTSELYVNASAFWSETFDGATGTPDLSETYFFTITFAPTYYLGPNAELPWNEWSKLQFESSWWWSYDEPFGGNDFQAYESFEGAVAPALVPLPASLPLLLAGLGFIAAARRRRG